MFPDLTNPAPDDPLEREIAAATLAQLSFAQARWMRVQASFSASVEVA